VPDSVAPTGDELMPAVDAMGKFVRPPVRLKVPVCSSMVPPLVNWAPMVVVPVPTDFLNVPLLLNTDRAPPPKVAASEIPESVRASNVPLLSKTAPWLKPMLPLVHVVVPGFSSLRPSRSPPLQAIPPLAKVVPEPVMRPPFQVK